MTVKHTIKNIEQLKEAGFGGVENDNLLREVAERFSVSLTPGVLEILKNESGSAVYSQYVPSIEELKIADDEISDPIGDDIHTPVKGITHRYPDRLLFKPIHTCAVYCRFCFRRDKVGRADQALNKVETEKALEYIKNNKEVWEVILSGGDPLLMSPAKLKYIIQSLSCIEHVKVIRLHTRIPLVAPEKISKPLLQSLETEKALFTVIHCNSHKELNKMNREAVRLILNEGIPVLSQSVLLRGVNDSADLLEKLFRSLVEIRVKPYYLHHADKAEGTSHFRTTISEGQKIFAPLRGKVSGLCIPAYVLDIPGGKGKVPISAGYLSKEDDGYKVKDWRGCRHIYKD